jgi:hypothetical protein
LFWYGFFFFFFLRQVLHTAAQAQTLDHLASTSQVQHHHAQPKQGHHPTLPINVQPVGERPAQKPANQNTERSEEPKSFNEAVEEGTVTARGWAPSGGGGS